MIAEEGQVLNAFPWYKSMRETNPVYRDPASTLWNVFRFQDVQRVLTDYAAFSSQMMGSMGGDAHPLASSMINVDPPRHRQLRSLVTQAFTPRTVARLATRITTIVHELLDQVAARGEMDLIDDLAVPLPVMIIAELLGVPTEDLGRFRHWSNMVTGEGEVGDESEGAMAEYFNAMFRQRQLQPQDDLITGLLEAEIDGQRLSPEELFGFCLLLLVAGNITTTNLIGNAFLCFQEYPQALEQLYADRSLVPSAVEEVLRYRSPVRCMFRVAVGETQLGDQTIEPGNMLLAWIASANRDEQEFANADTFDITRTPNRHIAFGHGIHFCLGAPLARLEAKIALEVMLERFSSMHVNPKGAQLEPVSSLVLHGVNHLPLAFEVR